MPPPARWHPARWSSTTPADYRNGDTHDGMAVQWFDSYADFMALLQTPEYAAKMQPDETRILDLSGMVVLFTEEAEVFIR